MNEKLKKVIIETTPKRNVLKNMIKAFLIGGLICAIAEIINFGILYFFEIEKDIASIYTVIIMIFLGAFSTGLGLYDRLGQFAGCGTIIPITGFANSMTSSALESKSEGLILGIITNVFKLAGSVIVTGVLCGVIIGTIRYLVGI